jgi:hypothetical protein
MHPEASIQGAKVSGKVLPPIVSRYQERDLAGYYRGDTSSAKPNIDDYLENGNFVIPGTYLQTIYASGGAGFGKAEDAADRNQLTRREIQYVGIRQGSR